MRPLARRPWRVDHEVADHQRGPRPLEAQVGQRHRAGFVCVGVAWLIAVASVGARSPATSTADSHAGNSALMPTIAHLPADGSVDTRASSTADDVAAQGSAGTTTVVKPVDWVALNPGFAGATFVNDPETCAQCHGDYVERYRGTTHGRLFERAPPAGTGDCESCHGPRSGHLEDVTVSLTIDPGSASASAVCLQCHDSGPRLGWKAGALTFSNHPDMRRFDVSDRRGHQVDVTVNLTPRGALAITGFIRHRDDDFASGVVPAQPLLGSGLADATASTPGDLGLLEDRRTSYGLDVFVQPNERASLNAFLNYDLGASVQRSLEYNENNKQNPSSIANAELGPWTRAASQWTADTDDRTWSAGLSSTLQVVPERLTLVADYTLSLATVDITYDGFGVTNFDGTPLPPKHQFAFSTPPPIRENLHAPGCASTCRSARSCSSPSTATRTSTSTTGSRDRASRGSSPWAPTRCCVTRRGRTSGATGFSRSARSWRQATARTSGSWASDTASETDSGDVRHGGWPASYRHPPNQGARPGVRATRVCPTSASCWARNRRRTCPRRASP